MIIFRVVWSYIVTLSASNTTMPLLSHRVPMDMSGFLGLEKCVPCVYYPVGCAVEAMLCGLI